MPLTDSNNTQNHSNHRQDSFSSFDEQFDDCLDAALANLEANPF